MRNESILKKILTQIINGLIGLKIKKSFFYKYSYLFTQFFTQLKYFIIMIHKIKSNMVQTDECFRSNASKRPYEGSFY